MIRLEDGDVVHEVIEAFAVLLLILCLAFAGCRPAAEPGEGKPAPAKSSARLLADGITGKYAIDAGQRAKADIQAISDQQNAALEAVLEE